MVQDAHYTEATSVRRRMIPLRAVHEVREGEYGQIGFKSEFFGVGSVMVPVDRVGDAQALSWSDIGIGRSHRPYAFKSSYKPVDIYQRIDEDDLGVELIMAQSFDGIETSIWHISQDLVFALELLREGDNWLRPVEDYIDVVRFTRKPDGREALVEIRAEFLRNYLSARQMLLKITSYRQRQSVLEEASRIDWPTAGLFENTDGGQFEGRVVPIHEGGHPFWGKDCSIPDFSHGC